MGQGVSTQDVESTVTNKTIGFARKSELDNYAKSSDLDSYAKSSALNNYLPKSQASNLYVDESDKADPIKTDVKDNTKWVTPKYVDARVSLGGVNPSAVASNLALNPDFSPILTEALGTNAAFQIGVAQNLATSGNFQTAVSSFITGTEQEAQNFRTNLIESMAKDVRFRGPQGAQGTFNVNAMERELKDKRTLWCADGELCKVPSAKGTGIQFTGGDQIIQGFASTATDPKVVKLDDHLALNASGSIDFARNLTREEGVTNSENIGKLDGRILANFPAGNQPAAIDGTALEIHGISKPSKLDDAGVVKDANQVTRRKLVKVYDDLELNGNLILNKGNIILGTEKGKRMIIHTNSDSHSFHVAPDKEDGTWDWGKEISLQRNGIFSVNQNLTINNKQEEALTIAPHFSLPTDRGFIRWKNKAGKHKMWAGVYDNRSYYTYTGPSTEWKIYPTQDNDENLGDLMFKKDPNPAILQINGNDQGGVYARKGFSGEHGWVGNN